MSGEAKAIRLRPAGPADVPRVRAIAEAAYRPFVAEIGRPPAPMVADFAAAAGAGSLYVLEEGEATLAYIHLYPKGDLLHIENLAVAPEARRRGLARRLLAFAEEEAGRRGIACLDLYTNEVMKAAYGLYIAEGFTEVERRVEAGFRRVYLQKPLSTT